MKRRINLKRSNQLREAFLRGYKAGKRRLNEVKDTKVVRENLKKVTQNFLHANFWGGDIIDYAIDDFAQDLDKNRCANQDLLDEAIQDYVEEFVHFNGGFPENSLKDFFWQETRNFVKGLREFDKDYEQDFLEYVSGTLTDYAQHIAGE